MIRKINMQSFRIFQLGDEWRSEMSLFSKLGESDDENFNAMINMAIKKHNDTPEEIKKETFETFKKVFMEITDKLKTLQDLESIYTSR